MTRHNENCTCFNCPAFVGERCRRRPDLDVNEDKPIKFSECPEYNVTEFGYMLENMRVLILGIDGYLGWTLALWLGQLGCQVYGVDNFSRRKWVQSVGSESVVHVPYIDKRLVTAQEKLGTNIIFKNIDIYKEREKLEAFLKEIKPEAIVHYAECPSAPYSMIDVDHAVFVQDNNVIGTLNLLFLMRDICPTASLIHLGTMGEYGTPLSGRPIFEGIFPKDAILKYKDREWSLGNELVMRDAGSWYHLSKVHNTYNIKKACDWWKLRSVDVMQGVIFGVHTPQVSEDISLRTRFDIDECFGTVVNRFVAQAIVDIPLTLYGLGEQTRGFIALRDAMQCMTRILCHPPLAGEYKVVNQLSGFYTIDDLARTVSRIGKGHFKLPVKIQRTENPRIEAERHPYDPVYDNLYSIYGFRSRVTLEDEIYEMFQLLTHDENKQRVKQVKDQIIPKVWWSGRKKVVDRLELIK